MKKLSKIKLSKIKTRKHKHNFPIVESILLSLTIFLSFSLFLVMMVDFAKDHIFNIGRRTAHHHIHDDNSWKHVHHRGEIDIKERNDNRPLNTYKYYYKSDLPFQALLDILSDPIHATEWFAWTFMDEDQGKIEKPSITTIPATDLVHVQMKVPFVCHHNREFLLETTNEMSTVARDDDTQIQIQKAIFHYNTSSEESLGPFFGVDSKKGDLEMKVTLFTQDDKADQTDIEMIVYMDLHTFKRIPTFIKNNVSLQWGSISLMKLLKQCRDNIGLKDTHNTKISFYNLFPIKR